MTGALAKGYTNGTHRLVAPEETLARIQPHLASVGITRCADVTGLDRIGIPVYCAIRPANRSIQVSNGKGLRPVDAMVSAFMEAIELFHAEHPDGRIERGSLKSLRRAGRRAIPPDRLRDYRTDTFFSQDFVIDWVKGEDLLSGEEIWLPAAAAYMWPSLLYQWSSNGLASGNHLVEATLHGLYELMERDAVSRLARGRQVHFTPWRCRFIDLKTLAAGPVAELADRVAAADIKLVLIWVKSCVAVHTFLAVLLDRQAFSPSSTVSLGYGTHRSAGVAAVRAITEAAQARATYIHGAREDLTAENYRDPHRRLFRFFDRIEATTAWDRLPERAAADLQEDYDVLLRALAEAGHRDVFRVDLTRPPFEIPVMKVWVSGLKRNPNLF
jgi:ribosomal protein S12 methylthiotransferase accessory factor